MCFLLLFDEVSISLIMCANASFCVSLHFKSAEVASGIQLSVSGAMGFRTVHQVCTVKVFLRTFLCCFLLAWIFFGGCYVFLCTRTHAAHISMNVLINMIRDKG